MSQLTFGLASSRTDPPERIQCSTSDFLNNPELQTYADKVDAIVSAGGLHWVGDTLFELRTSLQLAEQERRGGIANRVSPMISQLTCRLVN